VKAITFLREFFHCGETLDGQTTKSMWSRRDAVQAVSFGNGLLGLLCECGFFGRLGLIVPQKVPDHSHPHNCCIQNSLWVIIDPTHTKASINTYTRFFSYGLVATVRPSKGRPSMTKLDRSTAIRCLFFGVLLVLAPNSWPQTRPPILEKVAKTYGLDSWDQIQAIRYTWNLQSGALNISHSWEWGPKTGKVSYEGKDKIELATTAADIKLPRDHDQHFVFTAVASCLVCRKWPG
jgi:hypothetical protein